MVGRTNESKRVFEHFPLIPYRKRGDSPVRSEAAGSVVQDPFRIREACDARAEGAQEKIFILARIRY